MTRGGNCFRRAAALLLALLLAAACALPAFSAPALTQEAGLYAADVQPEAEAYLLVSLDDPAHPVIAQKNKDMREYPASLTKIATAAVVLDHVRDLQQTTVVSQRALDALADTGAQTVDLAAGDRVTYEELLYLTMVYSACDACLVLSEAVGGTEEHFVEMMNAWAEGLGCHDTHFVNSHGLHEDDHYSTAADLARMTLAALENDAFLKFAGATSYTFRGKTYEHTNVLLLPDERSEYYPYAQGIKTGTTKKAGSCLITKGEKDGCSYLAVLLDSSYY
ncbi:MAG: D-alanyl-D-alanine carboxypeptidase, partial [Clostridia bacterium]|nr:D-alanyl-D-alanine carboxypeptidase [Clostridia bacterium]